MENLAAIYPERFFARRYKLNWRAVPICHAIINYFFQFNDQGITLGEPDKPYLSIMDVGCATGDLVGTFNSMGYRTIGVEGSQSAEPYLDCRKRDVVFADISEDSHAVRALPLPRLLTCFEVAEHIDEPFALQFVANLTRLCDRILMSIAPPGQGGHHHVNCREIEYWDALFAKFEFHRRQEPVNAIRAELEPYKSKPGVKAIHQNLTYYEAIKPVWYIDADKRLGLFMK